jgi:hypothetical protein
MSTKMNVTVEKTASKKTTEVPEMTFTQKARAKFEENQRKNSIFLELEAGKNVIAIIKGIGSRYQEFKQGESQVIDLKIEVEDQRIKTCGVPEFAIAAWDSILTIMEAHNIQPSVDHPVGTFANLKTYQWTPTEDIPIVIIPSIQKKAGDRIWIAKINEIPVEVA